MAPKNRIIIDTDPGVDDVLAMLLALSASPEELEVVMLSVTYGNVELRSCLRNVVGLFHVLEKELAWRESSNFGSSKYGAFKTFKPIVAVGAERPLEDELLMADYFHGEDGLHGVHAAHPDLTPADTWRSLFSDNSDTASASSDELSFSSYFTPAKAAAHKEIIRILKEEPEDTITIVAVGPLTNLALAAAEDPIAFLRAKEVVIMGGTIDVPGNITPVGEFNTYADAVAAARVYALTAPVPASTMPPVIHGKSILPPYPAKLPRQLKLTLLPLDITTPHLLKKGYFLKSIAGPEEAGSPLARWVKTFMVGTFKNIETMTTDKREAGLSLHDPLCIWYMLLRDDPEWKTVPSPEDIRVETSGQWTRGMHVVDRRARAKAHQVKKEESAAPAQATADELEIGDIPGDTMGWLSAHKGNRINRIIGSPGEQRFAEYLMSNLFG